MIVSSEGLAEVGMELVDTEESISLPKASFKPIIVLEGVKLKISVFSN